MSDKPSPFAPQPNSLAEPVKTFWYYNQKKGSYEQIDLTTGLVVSERAEIQVMYDYNPLVVDIICQKIAEGGSLTRICEGRGMPSYAIFCRWRREYPEIDKQLDMARRDRAESLRDRALDHANEADEDNVASQRLKHDAYKWAAGVDDSKYSPKAKLEASVTMPTMIVLNTGIDRRAGGVNTGSKGTLETGGAGEVVIESGAQDTISASALVEAGAAEEDGLDF